MLIHGNVKQNLLYVHHSQTGDVLKADVVKIHTNRDSGGMIRAYLPEDAPSGMEFMFAVTEAYQFNIDPQSKILFAGDDAIANRYYSATVIGSVLGICADEDGNWVVISKHGTWTRET